MCGQARAAFPTQSKCIAGWDAGKVCVSAGWRISFVFCFGFILDQVNGERWVFWPFDESKSSLAAFGRGAQILSLSIIKLTVLLQDGSALECHGFQQCCSA